MDIRQLRHVLALVEHGNFHRAAEHLDLTQPALTKSLQLLERDLGVRLFDRHGRSVVPTVFGQIVARTARLVLDALDGMTREIQQLTTLEVGELSVGAGPYVAEVWLGPATGRLLRKYPQLRLSLHVEHWGELPELLRRGRIDLFVGNVEHVRGQAELRVVEFPRQQGVWVARAGHPLALESKRDPAAIRRYTLVGPQAPESIQKWLAQGGAGLSLLERRIETASVSLMRSMIREGDALSLVHPDMVRQELESGDFVTLPFDAPEVWFQSGIVWLADRSLSPPAKAFARELCLEAGFDPDLLPD